MVKLETLAVHAAFSPDPTTGAVAPPIHLSTNFARNAWNFLAPYRRQ